MRSLFLLPSLFYTAWAITISGTIPAQDVLATLHPSTRLTLQDSKTSFTSLVTVSGAFQFRNVPDDRNASYALTISSLSHSFHAYRIDVTLSNNNNDNDDDDDGSGVPSISAYKRPVGSKFSLSGPRVPYPLTLTPTGRKEYYTPRPAIHFLTLLKSPMVWLGLVMVFSLFVLPRVTAYIDPEGVKEMHEIRARKAEEAKTQPRVENPVEQLQNFDVSGWLAGKR